MSAREAPLSLARLRDLHDRPQLRIIENYRYATPVQMEFYYAAFEALPALLAVVEVARDADLFELFDDAKVYPAQKRLAAALEAFGE